MMWEYSKALGAYSATWFLGFIGSRYHLNAEQMAAITADVMAVATAVYGVYSHGQAAKMMPPNGGQHESK